MRQYVDKYVTDYPELLDLVAAEEETERDLAHSDGASSSGGAPKQPALLFPLHLPLHEVLDGLKSRRFLKGTIRCARDSPSDCYVVVHSADGVTRRSVQIKGTRCIMIFIQLLLR